MKKIKIKKIVFYSFSILILLVLIGGVVGIRYFNNLWFKERVDYLKISTDFKPVKFEWTESNYGDYVENKDAINIPAKINGIRHNLVFQFDTGDPTTRIYRNSFESLKKMGLELFQTKKGEKEYIEALNIVLGESQTNLEMILIDDNGGEAFNSKDTISDIRIGTIGADFINKYITEIDFKNQQIQFYKERETWMTVISSFTSFDFVGRRFMLPCEIDEKKIELFYDSGSSAFGLITTKNRYLDYSKNDSKEITYNTNMHGDPIPVRHKSTEEMMKMGGLNLNLKRVSYVDMYSDFQGFISPFTRIGGWLGNKPFINCSLIFDIEKEAFVIVEK